MVMDTVNQLCKKHLREQTTTYFLHYIMQVSMISRERLEKSKEVVFCEGSEEDKTII